MLLFRRTTAFGALASAAVLLNVAALNFFYDVPVKLYSSNLLLMSFFLLVPDLRRLANVLVLNRPAPAAESGWRPFRRRWMRIAAVSAKVLTIAFLLGSNVIQGWMQYRESRSRAKPPLYGLYTVDQFLSGSIDITWNAGTWRKVAVDFFEMTTVRTVDDRVLRFRTTYDAPKSKVMLSGGGQYELAYSRPDDSHVLLQGTQSGEHVTIKLRAIDVSKLQLVSRGFHWISEYPYNR